MTIILCALVAFAVLALYVYCDVARLSPDGTVYLEAALGQRVPRPFHLRPLLPMILGTRVAAWRAASALGLFVASVCVGAMAAALGSTSAQAVTSSALFAGLPMVRTTLHLPVLVDGPALGLTALSALLAVTGHPFAAAGVACVGAGVKEHVPVFAALASWSAWPLCGLAVVAALWLFVRPARPEHPSQTSPMSYARTKQRTRLLSAAHTVLPWGACLLVLLAPGRVVMASLAAGYAMLFVSADSTRIYQWAAIPVCIVAATVVPPVWLLPVAVAHMVNPWRGDV